MPDVYYELLFCTGTGEYRAEYKRPEEVEFQLDENYVKVFQKETGLLSSVYNKDFVIAVRLVEEEGEDEQT